VLNAKTRENAGETVANSNISSLTAGDASDEDIQKGGGSSAFGALDVMDAGAEEEEDFGGLMVRHTGQPASKP
jgi:hypothetical protein